MAPKGFAMKPRLCFLWLLLAAISSPDPAEGSAGLNVDFGTDYGIPAASYGAASGQAGDWNLVGLGVTALVDLGGGASGVSLSLASTTDGGDNGVVPTNDDETLLHDNFFSSSGSGWSVSLSGLGDGYYRVYLYAPANFAVSSGAMSVGGVPVASIPGNSSTLVEGSSWVSVDVAVAGGALAISGSSAGASGLAGLQLVPIVPPAALNVDFGTAYGVPTASYGAASGQAGDWNLVGLGVTALVDVAGDASGVSLSLVSTTDGGYVGATPTNDDQLMLYDNFFSSGGASWSVSLSGLVDGDYRVYLYAPAHLAVPSGDMDVGGVPIASIPGDTTLVEGSSWVSVDVAVAGGALAISGSSAGTSGLAGLQIVPLVAADLNVDFGTSFGTPAASYAAAGQAGDWNLTGLGVTTLVGPNGTPSGVSSNLVAGSDGGDNGVAPANDDELLLHDNFFSSGGASWTITLSGLGSGDYRFRLYAPANLAVPSGDMVVGGAPVASIPGGISTLSPGTSWVLVDVTHPGGALEISGAGSTFSGLSGLQVEYLPEPDRLPLRLAGLGCVLWLARRRRAGEVRSNRSSG
jgi:hypothetical protein